MFVMATAGVIFLDGGLALIAAWMLGFVVALLIFGWMIGFDVHSLTWLWGAWGEEKTGEELAKLGPGWRVYHDIPDGNGNWDHVLVGAAGVFIIDSKNLSQPATVDEKGLRSGRLRYGGAATRGSAVRLKELIQQRTGLSVWVQGVVAVWGQLPQGEVERDKVLYVPGTKLIETLESRPDRLSDAHRAPVLALLDEIVATASR